VVEHWSTWVLFAVVVVGMMAIDLGVAQRGEGVMSTRKALMWTALWVSVAMAFNVFVYFSWGPGPAAAQFTCYVIEQALSVDNLFVFVVIFASLGIKGQAQRRVLFWGIIGAVITRGAFIFAGVRLLDAFSWITYVLGGFLVFTGLKMLGEKGTDVDPKDNPVLKLARRYFRVSESDGGRHMFVREAGKLMATPLFIALLAVESTDILFAVDSVPAALGVTQQVEILYTSNILAVMGLRALYFAIAGLLQYLQYLNYALAAILSFIGLKLCFKHWIHMSDVTSLLIVAGILAVAVVASLVRGRDRAPEGEAPADPNAEKTA